MGYTTDFTGQVTVDPPLNEKEIDFLRRFSDSRRMDRERGPYYANPGDNLGQGPDDMDDVRSMNDPPEGQPGAWCEWTPTDDGTAIEWNGAEKFYNSAEWMAYIIQHFLMPGARGEVWAGLQLENGTNYLEGFTFDHVCNGIIGAQGEEPDDRWRLVVKDNKVTVEYPKLVWPS